MLANDIKPKNLNEYVGQKHLIDKGEILYNLLSNKVFFNIILFGPPGVGKTTLANIIATKFNEKVRFLNAVINNKKDFDVVVEEAKMYGSLILIIDEFHRMNKDKQDLLLPFLETDLIKIVGLTTTNPYHTINEAIRSRVHIFKLHPLLPEDLKKASKKIPKYLKDFEITPGALDSLIAKSNGDLRYFYNLCELAYYALDKKKITLKNIKKIGSNLSMNLDKKDDNFYNIISALQKSIRGSDPDAALYYLSLLILKEDFDIISRRLRVIAYEDIGLANPSIGYKVNAAINTVKELGLDEGKFALSTVVIEMALSPKSNSAYLAVNNSINLINKLNISDVPKHLINHNPKYKYPFNYENNFVLQDYLPDKIKHIKFYLPQKNKYEQNLDIYRKNIGNKGV